MDFHLITFLICKLIPVTCSILENFHQKLTFILIVYAKKSTENCSKLTKLLVSPNLKGVEPVVPLEVGCKLAYSGLFDANISNVR